MMTRRNLAESVTRSWLGLSILTVCALGVGCKSFLEVENPNSVTDDDIRNDASAVAWTNGSLRAVQVGWDNMLAIYSAASDELKFVGTRRAARQVDLGYLTDLNNEFTTSGFRDLAAGVWMADETIFVLDSLDGVGSLTDRAVKARAYLYAGIAYQAVADWLEDYAFSDRMEAGPAVGTENMWQLYDGAIAYLDAGLEVVVDDSERRDLLGMRARVRHARLIWDRIGTIPIDISNGGLVTGAEAVQDARAALAEDPTDWRFAFEFIPEGDISIAANAAQGGGRWGDRYVRYASDGGTIEGIVLLDPIDGVPAPRLEAFIIDSIAGSLAGIFPSLPVISAREMRLIIAEDALARGDTATFATELNINRALDGVAPWSAGTGIDARDMLIYERQVQLFLQGRRLNDLYRFGLQSDNWESRSDAFVQPGTFFPIPASEIEANCHLNPDVSC